MVSRAVSAPKSFAFWNARPDHVANGRSAEVMRDAAGASWSAWVLTGIFFGVTHVPNPVLAPATLVWGVVASRMFEHRPAIIPIAMLQTLLSALLLWLTPADWSHQFRIGPGYWY